MRKTTLLWLILAAFCGTALFHTSQKVHDEREKLGSLDVSIGKEEESLRVLNAEWSYLNQPAKLEKLAKTYLGPMAPLKGSQFVKVEDIPLRGEVVAEAAPAPVVKIKDTPQPQRHPVIGYSPKTVRGSGRLYSRLIDSQDTQTRYQTPAQGGGDDTVKSATNTRNFTDVMKNLGAGVE